MNDEQQKLIVYATSANGEGYVQELGRYDSVEDIQIRIGMFSNDVLITIEYEPRTGKN